MTALLHAQAKQGEKIIANYKLNFPFTPMRFDKMAEMPEEIEGSTIGMDELGKGADSYEFFTKRSKNLATLVMESRKRHCMLYYTVQRFGLIAARLRAQTEEFFLMEDLDARIPHCKCVKPECTCGTYGYKCATQFVCQRFDINARFVGRNLFDGRPFHHLFNTDEIVWK